MKRFWTALVVAALSTVLLAACAKPANEPAQYDPAVGDTPAVSDSLKTGLYAATSYDGSSDAQGGEAGLVKIQVTLVAVTVDAGGRIDGLRIDQIQAETAFSETGKITGDTAAPMTSKNDLGSGYGMASASSIGKEWDAQMRAFEAYCIGKTVAALKGIAFDDAGKPADPDLAASVTLSTAYFVNYIEAAANSAQSLGAMRGDTLALAVAGDRRDSKSAEGGDNGYVRADLSMAAVTTGADGVITSCVIDGLQADLAFGANGKLAGDTTGQPKTKNELGNAYGLAGSSAIGKEWREQALALAAYVTGKTAAQVEGIALDETGKADDADLLSSVTISIADYVALVARAARTAQAQPAGETALNG